MSAIMHRAAFVALIGFLALPSQATAGEASPSPYVIAEPGYDSTFHPVCLSGTHYACRIEPFGTRFCGCWIGGDHPACPIGYVFACGPAPNGARNCGCF